MTEKLSIAVLDAATLGDDVDLSVFKRFGSVAVYKTTAGCDVQQRAENADVLVLNKIKINESTLPRPGRVRLVCIAATGFDNVDVAYCKRNGIAVCNVVGYSTDSVAQLTVAMALSLFNHIPEFNRAVRDGSYTEGGVANMLTPVFHELRGKTWGVIGFGNIGRQVGRVAEALGCRVIGFRRNPANTNETDDIEAVCRSADVISIHLPLSESTRGIISRELIDKMKTGVILINAARGAVTDEQAVSDAVLSGKIGGFGCDVYSVEPMPKEHPFNAIKHLDNVCLTPHNGWGAYEARVRCLEEMSENIKAFLRGERRNRVD